MGMKIRRLFELKGICCILIKVVVIAMYTFVKTHQLQLEEEMATHSRLLPGESHGQRSLVGYSSGDQRVRHD